MRMPSCLLAIAIVASCATTASIEDTWRSPAASPGELTNVVTLFPTHDGVLRRTAEDKLARRLAEHGVRAVPAYMVLTAADLRDRDAAAIKLRQAGFDGVVAMHIVDAHQRLEVYPTWDIYWGSAWTSVYPVTIVRVQVDAYHLPDHTLVWSAISKSVDPANFRQLVDAVAKVASKDLASDRVIMAAR